MARQESEDKFQAISTLEIIRHLPILADDDLDLAGHNEAFDMHIATQCCGG
jgi:hypothetical protein